MAALITVLLVTLYRYSSEIFPIDTNSDSAILVFDIQKHIAKNYKYRITLKVLSKEFFFSEYYISRIFKKVTGYNYKKYLVAYRLSIAKEMLVNSKNTITEISALCGYKNINHFNRIFKSYTGMPPTKYRKLE